MQPDQGSESEIEETDDVKEEESIPVFLTKLDNGNLVCHTGQGDFEFTDIPYERVLSAKKRATRGQGSQRGERLDIDTFNLMLVSESMVSAKMGGITKSSLGELEIKKLKTSTVLKLNATINHMYDIKSFLSI